MEKKWRKIEKGKVGNLKWKEVKLQNQNEESIFFFFFFAFHCLKFKTTENCFGSTKMEIFYWKNAFHAGKIIMKKWLCLLWKIVLLRPCGGGTLPYKTDRYTAPIFKVRGILWSKNHKNTGVFGWEVGFDKKGVFALQNFKRRLFFYKFWGKFVKILFFKQFLPPIFDQNKSKIWGLWVTQL